MRRSGQPLRRGYNVLMVDLPGQGRTPCDGLHFGTDTVTTLEAVLDQADQLGFTGKRILRAALRKYDWQFGAGGLANLLGTFAEVGVADYTKIDAPSLFLVGLSEDRELRRQARIVYGDLKARRPESRMVKFPLESGADAHCQVNNLPWAQHHVFRWLHEVGLDA